MDNPCKESFEKWWEDEGEIHEMEIASTLKEICEIAWSNGAYKMLEAVERGRKYETETKE